jgi:hypothetical protein
VNPADSLQRAGSIEQAIREELAATSHRRNAGFVKSKTQRRIERTDKVPMSCFIESNLSDFPHFWWNTFPNSIASLKI